MVKLVRATLALLFVFSMSAGSQTVAAQQQGIRFEEISKQAGIRVQHHTRRFQGKTGDVLHMFTSGGSAVAVGDYDNDGFDDIFATDSDTGKPNHLFHNNGNLTFTDVAEMIDRKSTRLNSSHANIS